MLNLYLRKIFSTVNGGLKKCPYMNLNASPAAKGLKGCAA
jgi:hypothetical protein